MTVTALEVRQVYRALLGRDPEDDSVISRRMDSSADLESLIVDVKNSPEFQSTSSGSTRMRSSVCKFADFGTEWYCYWSDRIAHSGVVHRKAWEWCILSQVLFERGMLHSGMRGLGFAVGQEPLPSLFASHGVSVDATDMVSGEVSESWSGSGEHADGLDALYKTGIVDRATFDRQVNFFPVDMTDLDALPSDTYDFLWSSCAMEHLGSLDNGLDFVRKAMRLLKVGGVACHTTELNLSSLEDTVSEGRNVIYREKDIRRLAGDLRRDYCVLEEVDFRPGWDREDALFDSVPWGHRGHSHIKLELDGVICTSMVLICRKFA